MELTSKIEIIKSQTQTLQVEKSNTKPLVLKIAQTSFNTLGRVFPSAAARVAYKLFTTPRIRARHKKSDQVLESTRVFEFIYGKHILKGYEWGQGDRIVLLVHGWESRGTAMRSFVPQLVSLGFKVVAFDAPAHGNSAGKRTNLPHFGGAVRAIINYLGGVYGIVSHSFGGASTVFTLANIDNSISIEKLVLIGVPSSMENLFKDFMKMIKAPSSVAKRFEKMLESRMNLPMAKAHISLAYQRLQVGETLVIHDREDQVVPLGEAQAVFEAWDNTSLMVTEGLGHFQLMKNPDVINRVAGFMKS
jgi:pimeloyl-ACP methyl ester carboxylesterase